MGVWELSRVLTMCDLVLPWWREVNSASLPSPAWLGLRCEGRALLIAEAIASVGPELVFETSGRRVLAIERYDKNLKNLGPRRVADEIVVGEGWRKEASDGALAGFRFGSS